MKYILVLLISLTAATKAFGADAGERTKLLNLIETQCVAQDKSENPADIIKKRCACVKREQGKLPSMKALRLVANHYVQTSTSKATEDDDESIAMDALFEIFEKCTAEVGAK
jgi:hypothetical protein